jgi:hypothetical protein
MVTNLMNQAHIRRDEFRLAPDEGDRVTEPIRWPPDAGALRRLRRLHARFSVGASEARSLRRSPVVATDMRLTPEKSPRSSATMRTVAWFSSVA